MQTTSIRTREMALFKQKLTDSLMKETSIHHTIKIAKNANIYLTGDKDNRVYFIEKGQIKLLMLSPEGKECLLSIYDAGSVFGELCVGERTETATAMTDTVLKTIPYNKFLEHLTKNSLLEGFVQYLAVRVADQQQVIANLVTVDSEQRLGKTLLQLAKSIGKVYSYGIVIELYISHEELSEMIGTTRPRISLFMQRFRNLGFIKITKDRYMIIDEEKLSNYLAHSEFSVKALGIKSSNYKEERTES